MPFLKNPFNLVGVGNTGNTGNTVVNDVARGDAELAVVDTLETANNVNGLVLAARGASFGVAATATLPAAGALIMVERYITVERELSELRENARHVSDADVQRLIAMVPAGYSGDSGTDSPADDFLRRIGDWKELQAVAGPGALTINADGIRGNQFRTNLSVTGNEHRDRGALMPVNQLIVDAAREYFAQGHTLEAARNSLRLGQGAAVGDIVAMERSLSQYTGSQPLDETTRDLVRLNRIATASPDMMLREGSYEQASFTDLFGQQSASDRYDAAVRDYYADGGTPESLRRALGLGAPAPATQPQTRTPIIPSNMGTDGQNIRGGATGLPIGMPFDLDDSATRIR